jgi:hypothetical protein
VHMMIVIPPKYAVSQVIGYIKGKSAIHLARVHGERKRNCVGQHFWARGYYVSTLGRDEAVIREYIRKQEQEDKRLDQMNLGDERPPSRWLNLCGAALPGTRVTVPPARSARVSPGCSRKMPRRRALALSCPGRYNLARPPRLESPCLKNYLQTKRFPMRARPASSAKAACLLLRRAGRIWSAGSAGASS